MISLKKRESGFTIVELLIVIVVIGILAALVITTYSGIQAKARNTKRQTDINSIQQQIEAYFQDSNNHYPSFADLSSSNWVTSTLKGLPVAALHDPSATGTGITLSQTAGSKVYQYAPLNSGGTSCESDDTTCTSYTLTATMESGVAAYTKTNLD